MSNAGQRGVMSIVYGAIVVAIMLVFIIQFRPNASQRTGALGQQCVVSVRDRCVDPKEFWAATALMAPRGLDEQSVKKMQIRKHAVDGLLERTLLVQDAKRLKITISEDDINRELTKGRVHMSLPVQQAGILAWQLQLPEEGVRYMPFINPTTKAFDYKVYQRVIKTQTNRSETEFKNMQREELVAERMRQLIRSRARVSDEEAFWNFVRERSTATLDYVTLHRAWFIQHYVDDSETAMTQWIKDHESDVDKAWASRKADYPAGCRQARHILVKLRTDTQPDGHEQAEAQSLVQKALARIKAGEHFGLVARDLSEDEGSAKRGGEVGCIQKNGKMVKPFEDAVFGLQKAGDIAESVETPYGLHIVQVQAVVPDDASKAEAEGRRIVGAELMRGMVAEQLMSDTAKALLRFAQEGKSLQQATDDALQTLVPLAEKKAASDKKTEAYQVPKNTDSDWPKPESTKPFTAEESPIPGVARDQNLAAAAFKLDKPGQVSGDFIKLDDGYAIIQLKEKKASTREDFDKERDGYIQRLVRQKGQDFLLAYIAKLKQQARIETRIDEKFTKEPEREQGQEDQGGD